MKQIKLWPTPDRVKVRVSWDWILLHYSHSANDVYNWVVDTPGDECHLYSYGDAEGLSYRVKDPKDATWFRLNWPLM